MSPSKMRQKSYRQKRYRSDEPRNVMGGEMVSAPTEPVDQ